MQLILSGEMIDAAEAWRIGLVNGVHPADQLRAKTVELAERICRQKPSTCLALAKTAVKAAARTNLREGLDLEVDLFSLLLLQ
jgi:enoyl-CoA hydratase